MSSGSGADVVRPQGFDVLRIVAASMVIVSHAFILGGGNEPDLLVFGDFAFNIGRLGVVVFFIVSGYLICGSWLGDPRPRAFAEKRARRLLPALALMLLLVTFVMGPLVTSRSGYLLDPGTYEFFLRNLLVFPYTYDLPGVFDDNPLPQVNGVLWTLGVEVLAYTLLGVAGALGWLRGWKVLAAVTTVFALVGWRLIAGSVVDGALVPIALRVELVAFFFAAATVRASPWRPGWRSAFAATAVLAAVLLVEAPLSILLVPGATVVVLYLGTRSWPAARHVTRFGDPSYGAYIYGFVIQQLLVAYLGFGDLPVWLFSVVSVVLGLGVGYASWHLVEERALRGAPRRPVAAAGSQQAAQPSRR